MSKDLILPQSSPLGLDPNILSSLSSYEEFLSLYLQIDEAHTAFSWLKADLLAELVKKYGEKSIEEFSKDIKQPRSTITNYVRTARAFPPEKRIAMGSFTQHFVASFADSYNHKTGEFASNNRLSWVEKSVDNGWSTRKLAEEIQKERLISDGSVWAKQQDAKTKIGYITKLLHDLFKSEKYEEIENIYNKVFNK